MLVLALAISLPGQPPPKPEPHRLNQPAAAPVPAKLTGEQILQFENIALKAQLVEAQRKNLISQVCADAKIPLPVCAIDLAAGVVRTIPPAADPPAAPAPDAPAAAGKSR